jgi:hypothetical protein
MQPAGPEAPLRGEAGVALADKTGDRLGQLPVRMRKEALCGIPGKNSKVCNLVILDRPVEEVVE